MKAKKSTIISTLSLAVFICITAFTTSTKKVILNPQDDPNVGFYADGVKVTELTCYSFKTLHIVIPYNDALNTIQEFALHIDVNNQYPRTSYKISKGKLLLKRKGKYVVFEIFNENSIYNEIAAPDQHLSGGGEFGRSWLAFYFDKYSIGDLPLNLSFKSLVTTGYKETFDQGCNCIKKTPEYDSEDIGLKFSLLLKNRTKGKSTKKVDMSQPCDISGTKVDFNNLGK